MIRGLWVRSECGVRILQFYIIDKFTKSEFRKIPFSVFRILLSVTAVICKGAKATEESPAF